MLPARFASFALAATLSLAAAIPAAAQTSYPLTCRGGGYMSIANDAASGVMIGFAAGGGAAPMGLQPGECTWSDRALRAGEPTVICDSVANALGYVQLLLQDSQYLILQVYNEGGVCMRVTRVGP